MANIIEKAEDMMSSATISHEVLREKLSEFLAVERGGISLYEQALRIVKDPEVSRKFAEFLDQTRKHETILLRVMGALGLDPEYMSSAAKIAEQKAHALLNVGSEVARFVRWPPSAAQTARAVFPHAAFTKTQLPGTQGKELIAQG